MKYLKKNGIYCFTSRVFISCAGTFYLDVCDLSYAGIRNVCEDDRPSSGSSYVR